MFAIKKFQHAVTGILVSFVFIICLIYTAIVFFSIEQTETHVVNNYIKTEFNRIKTLYNRLPEEQQKQTEMTLHDWLAQSHYRAPRGLQIYAMDSPYLDKKYAPLQPGFHDFSKPDVHVFVGTLDVLQSNIILIYDETKISQVDKYEPALGALFFVISVALILISILLAYYLSKKIADPIVSLNQQLKFVDSNQPFIEEERQDEIGELARGFSALLTRLNQFLYREQQFTRHASHELRTPVGVITNSLSVLKLPNISDEKRQRNIDRIEQANQFVNDLINTFLVLGREQSLKQKIENIDLHELIVASVEKHKNKQLKLNLSLKPVYVEANPVLASVLLDNIIKNAMAYGHSNVDITLNDNAVVITNDTSEQFKQSGYGFGKQIINRVLEEMNWTVEYLTQPNVYQVKVNIVT